MSRSSSASGPGSAGPGTGLTPSATGTGARSDRPGTSAGGPRTWPGAGEPRPRRRRGARRGRAGSRRARRSMGGTRSAGIGCPPNSQITVRSLNSDEKHRPWSIPQIRSPGPRRTWPLFRSVLLARTSKAHMAMSCGVEIVPGLVEREVVLLEVRLDEELEGAFAEGPVAQHRRGHQAPAEQLRQSVRGDLAPVEAGGEVPQRSLTSAGLVDGATLLVLATAA